VLLHKVHTGRNYGNLSVEVDMEVDMESEKAVGESVGVSGGVTHTQTPGTLSYVRLNAHVRNGGLVGSVVGTELTRSIKQ
jgi:hypothetical protein